MDVLLENFGLKVLCLSFIIKAKLKNDFLKIWYNKSFSKMAWKGVGRCRESRALIGYPMTHWAPPPRAPRTSQNALKYYIIESDFDLITLAQKLINKSFSKMAWNGVGRCRESRAFIWYPMTHWAPPPRAPRTPQNALKYYTIESDFDLMTLAQKLINKSFSKMPGKGFGMYRGSRTFIWYPIIHIWPHIIGQEVNWMTNF